MTIWARILSGLLSLAGWWTREQDRARAEEAGAMKARQQHQEAIDEARTRMDAVPSRPASDRLRNGSF